MNDIEEIAEIEQSDIDTSEEISPEAIMMIEEEAPSGDVDICHSRKIIEAVLFAAGYPVTYAKLGQVIGTSAGAAKRIVREYAEEYNGASYELERGITLLCF